MITKKKKEYPGKSHFSNDSCSYLKFRGQQCFSELFSICTPRHNRIEILISGRRTFVFLILIALRDDCRNVFYTLVGSCGTSENYENSQKRHRDWCSEILRPPAPSELLIPCIEVHKKILWTCLSRSRKSRNLTESHSRLVFGNIETANLSICEQKGLCL
jgi:hypothetical protein